VENIKPWTPLVPETEIDAFIFDCDGTLADTMPIHYKAWCATLGEHAVHFPEAMFNDLGGVPTHRVVEILNERHQLGLPVQELVAVKEEFFQQWSVNVQPIEAVVAVARRFHGIKPMAVASGGHRHIVRRTLELIGVLDLFGAVVCSEDTPRGKPHPDPFLEAARLLGVEPGRCLVFEDSVTGLSAAQAAGMQCIIVPNHR